MISGWVNAQIETNRFRPEDAAAGHLEMPTGRETSTNVSASTWTGVVSTASSVSEPTSLIGEMINRGNLQWMQIGFEQVLGPLEGPVNDPQGVLVSSGDSDGISVNSKVVEKVLPGAGNHKLPELSVTVRETDDGRLESTGVGIKKGNISVNRNGDESSTSVQYEKDW